MGQKHRHPFNGKKIKIKILILVAQRKMERKILQITYQNHIRYDNIKKRTQIKMQHKTLDRDGQDM